MTATVYKYCLLGNIFYILTIPVTIETIIFKNEEDSYCTCFPYGYAFRYAINLSDTKFKLEGCLEITVTPEIRKIVTDKKLIDLLSYNCFDFYSECEILLKPEKFMEIRKEVLEKLIFRQYGNKIRIITKD